MAVTTSQVTTASNGDLAISPNGSGKIKFSKLTGGSLPTGVLTDGTVQHFRVDQLSGATGLAANTVVMVQKNGETVVKKSSLADVVSAGGGVKLTDFSVATGAATAGGALAYNNTSGVFTFNPADLSDLIGLGSLSVSTGTASGGGSLSYDNSNGTFTFKPADLSGLGGGGIDLGDLSVTTASSATQSGGLSYNVASGVFTYTPVEYNSGTSSVTGLTLSGPTFKISVTSLPNR